MNNHTEKPNAINGSGYVALRDYFTLWLERLELFYNQRLEDLDHKTTAAQNDADKAVTKAEAATEKRFEGVNEFRQTLADQAATFIPRQEAVSKFENIQKDITALDKELQKMREADSTVTGRDLQRDQNRQTGEIKQAWTMPMVAAIGLGVLSILFNLILFIAPMLKGH